MSSLRNEMKQHDWIQDLLWVGAALMFVTLLYLKIVPYIIGFFLNVLNGAL
jgi:hypothetical protein